jgi:glycine betaine/proline transport system ATP-binding protein
MDTKKPAILEVKNLIKVFGKEPDRALELIAQDLTRNEIRQKTGQVVSLRDLSFDIREGEIFVIMGLSGSGKSTLLRTFNGLITPTRGSIHIDGTDITKFNETELTHFRRTQISMVFQNFALFPHRTLVENVEFGLEINHVPAQIRRKQALDALEMVKLKTWANSYPDQVSGGMQQRVGLARSLVLNPKIILMDEAFSALDPMIRSEMQDELIDLQKTTNNTIIFVSHHLDEALKIANRILILKEGRAIQCGTPEEILSNPSNEYVEKFVKDADVEKYCSPPPSEKKRQIALQSQKGISSLFARRPKMTGLKQKEVNV